MIVDILRHMWSMDQRFPSSYEGVADWELIEPADFDWETTTDSIITEMDEAKVDVSVLFVADFAPRLGAAPFDIEIENEFVGKGQDPSGAVASRVLVPKLLQRLLESGLRSDTIPSMEP